MLPLILATYFSLAPKTPFNTNQIPSELICIAQHESGLQQYTVDGSPLESPTQDYGVMQIHSSWLPLSKSMGLDIEHSAADNIAFGVYLYNKYGPTIWATYKYCAGLGT